jgi:hypothetical protein
METNMLENVTTETKPKFRVWGVFDGEVFDRTFPTATAWSAWRRINERRYQIEVFGMASEAN